MAHIWVVGPLGSSFEDPGLIRSNQSSADLNHRALVTDGSFQKSGGLICCVFICIYIFIVNIHIYYILYTYIHTYIHTYIYIYMYIMIWSNGMWYILHVFRGFQESERALV